MGGACGIGTASQATEEESDNKRKVRPSSAFSSDRKLCDYYDLGDKLGEGAFGVVYACSPKKSATQESGSIGPMAVKMVDKVESPVEDIQKETDLLRKMNHPNVIRCQDVFNEKCFVCIVMDRLAGGDLINAMQRHWKSAGRIDFNVTKCIVGQMAVSLAYLHGNSMIHRDVKGDNYLCTVGDITDPQIRIVLTDFGTSLEVYPPNRRLAEKCGTKLYWSPELWTQNYSYKVDVWAMGVVFYGLLMARFPFKNRDEAAEKQIKLSQDVPEELRLASLACLEKDEDKRPSAATVAANPDLKTGSGGEPKTEEKQDSITGKPLAHARPDSEPLALPDPGTGAAEQDTGLSDAGGELFRELGPNEGVKERRLELVDRLVDAHAHGVLKKALSTVVKAKTGDLDRTIEHYWKETFEIQDKRAGNSVFRYDWWDLDKFDAEFNLQSDATAPRSSAVARGSQIELLPAEKGASAIEVIKRMLQEHGIDTAAFGQGQAKTLEELYTEVQQGSAILMLDAQECKKLVRVVDVVCLRVVAPGEHIKFLIESGEKYPDGRRIIRNRLPGTKKKPWETSRQTAQRIMGELVHIGDAKVQFNFDKREVFEEEEDSPSYPGVFTVYRKEIIEGTILANDNKKALHRMKTSAEWAHEDQKKNTKFFRWLTEEQADKSGVVYKAPDIDAEVCALVQAPIGMEEEDLAAYLTSNGVDISHFGKGDAKGLSEISQELSRGDATLVLDSDGSVLRVVDVVLLKLINGCNGKALVQTEQTYPDGRKVELKKLPGSKHRPDENQFATARKVLRRSLKIEENNVTTNADQVQVVEEEKDSPSYPGLRTIYRKRIITAKLEKPEDATEEA